MSGVLRDEWRKAWLEVTVENAATAPQPLGAADWQSAIRYARSRITPISGIAGVSMGYDETALIRDSEAGVNNPSAGLFNFATMPSYNATKGAAFANAGPIATFWSDINLIFTRFKYFFMEYFTHNAISGLTLIQAPCYISYFADNVPGFPSGLMNASGEVTPQRGSFLFFGHGFYHPASWIPGQTSPYDQDRNALHELGHALFGMHQWTNVNEVTGAGAFRTGGYVDEHDHHDLCIMGYMPCSGGYCGRCVASQAGWDTRPMPPNGPGP